MPVSFQLPPHLEQNLRGQFADLDQAAKEAALVELYRQDKLTHHELSQALAIDRFQIDALLKAHHVTEDLPTDDELADDLKRLTRLVG